MRLGAIGGALLVTLALAGAGAGDAGGIGWEQQVPLALAAARESRRPVLVDVWAVWCAPCKLMDETTYRDPAVVRAAAAFVPLKVDADVNESFIERYRIDAFPTLLFLDGAGGELRRLEGLVATADLLEALRAVGNGYREYLDAQGRPDDPAALEVQSAYLAGAGNPTRTADLCRRALKLLDEPNAAAAGSAEGVARREALALRLGQALVAQGKHKPAAKLLEGLRDAEQPEVRGHALAALVRMHRERGETAEAERALELLARDFPDLARDFASTPSTSPH